MVSMKGLFVPNKSEKQSRSLSCVGKYGLWCCQSWQSLWLLLKRTRHADESRRITGCASTSLVFRSAASAVSKLLQLTTTSLVQHHHFHFHLWAHQPLRSRSSATLGSLSPGNLLGSFPLCWLFFKPGHWKGNTGGHLDFISQTVSFPSFLSSGWYSQCNCLKVNMLIPNFP